MAQTSPTLGHHDYSLLMKRPAASIESITRKRPAACNESSESIQYSDTEDTEHPVGTYFSHKTLIIEYKYTLKYSSADAQNKADRHVRLCEEKQSRYPAGWYIRYDSIMKCEIYMFTDRDRVLMRDA